MSTASIDLTDQRRENETLNKKAFLGRTLISLLIGLLCLASNANLVVSWSNGGYSADPSSPDYGTHDWIAQHALDWLPTSEKQYILDNLAAYLYGTELPDNGGAPEGIGDVVKHHVYYWSNRSLQDDVSAVRAFEEFHNSRNYFKVGNFALAAKTAGIMSHYIVDLAVFGHVMGNPTDWGSETHHSDYESYVRTRTSSYDDDFNVYLSFDGQLDVISAYDAAIELAYGTTFDVDGGLTCVWMDENYDWTNSTFKNRAGESLNLAVNYLSDVLHTLYLEATQPKTWTVDDDSPADFFTIQAAINSPLVVDGDTIYVYSGTYFENVAVNRTISLIGENLNNTIIDGNNAGDVVYVSANNTVIKGFTIQNGFRGVWFNNSHGNTFSLNNILSCDIRGVHLSGSNNNTLKNITVSEINWIGIWIEGSSDNIVAENSVTNTTYGIRFIGSSNNNTIERNVLANNDEGIHLNSNYNNIINNSLYNNSIAIGIWSWYNNITGNLMNNIIRIEDSNYNRIYHNNFYDAAISWHGLIHNDNIWDNGYPSGGNYWSDYTGVDFDGDGIGDTPYIIDGDNQDNYPLMSSWTELEGDIDGDSDVDYDDFIVLAGAYGTSIAELGYHARADFDNDGDIDYDDFIILAGNYGTSV